MLNNIYKAIKFLESSQLAQRTHYDKLTQIFDVWETINITHAIFLWSKEFNFIQDLSQVIDKNINFLKLSENSKGIVYHSSNHNDNYCVETSSEYIRLLLYINPNITSGLFHKIEYLKSKQTSKGYWNIDSPMIPSNLQNFPSVTAFALRVLHYSNQEPMNKNLALQFLINSQKIEGHWGVEWEYYGNPYYPMLPISHILSLNKDELVCKRSLQKAKNYLIYSQKSNGSWYYKLKGFHNIPSPELQTGLAIQCCLNLGFDFNNKAITKSIKWLLHNQRKEGYWNGGYFPHPNENIKKKEDLFATSQALVALYHYFQQKIE